MLIAVNYDGYKDINKIISEANKTGFYKKPRIDKELLLSINPKNTIVTSACIASRLNSQNAEEEFLKPVLSHFGENFYLEVQAHVDNNQAKFNKYILYLSDKYNVPIIHANDSHYIYPENAKDRQEFLQGKGINYPEEDNFILDYPDSDIIFERYKQQGILTEEQVKKALENTLIFDKCEDLKLSKDIKMPSIYPNLSIEEKHKKFKKILNQKWKEEKQKGEVNLNRIDEYKKAIKDEVDIIEQTAEARTVDYFLLNEKIINKAVNEYGGILTRTGRGSAVSFYINKLLGFTEVDRLEADVPLFPTRFMSVSRILETKSLPDIDFNTGGVEPFVKASQDILGEDNVHLMITYGTMQKSEAFRHLCRAKGLKYEEYNEIAKDVDEYENDPKWKNLIEESKKFRGVIDSFSPSPCSYLLLNQPISEEIGLIKINNQICCQIDGGTADDWNFLKNDYLIVSVWKIINDTFKLIDKSIPTIKELRQKLDNKVWELYKKGLTANLNQVDSQFATPLVKRFSPKEIAELTMFVAAIRPGFVSLLENFIQRQDYSTGVKELDELLKDSYHYILFQESVMRFLIWCGIHEDETYGIIKKISKKKFKEKEINELKKKLKKGFKENLGNEDGFDEAWAVIERASLYMFNASHAFSMALDSIYCAYLKANYPLEFYTVILNTFSDNIEKQEKIVHELPYFNIKIEPIKFGKSQTEYTIDKENYTIIKSLQSIKHLNSQIATELYNLSYNTYNHFLDLLIDIKNETSVNSKQLDILIQLDFFSDFGQNQKLLDFTNYFRQCYGKKQIKKDKAEFTELMKQFSKETEKTFTQFDSYNFLKELWNHIPDNKISLTNQLIAEKDYLGYLQTKVSGIKNNIYFVMDINTKYTPRLTVYNLTSGNEEQFKILKKIFKETPINENDFIYVKKFNSRPKKKKVGDEWQETGEYENYIDDYFIIDPKKLEKFSRF